MSDFEIKTNNKPPLLDRKKRNITQKKKEATYRF